MLLNQMISLLEKQGIDTATIKEIYTILESVQFTEVRLESHPETVETLVPETLVVKDASSKTEIQKLPLATLTQTIRPSNQGDEPTQIPVLTEGTQSGVNLAGEEHPQMEAGTLIGRYDRLGILGLGGMGEVLQVRDRELNRILALKVIHEEALAHGALSSRFTEEAQVVAQLQHPNIVPVHEMGKLPDGRLYFTMKEVKGLPLSTAIKDVHAAIRKNRWKITKSGWTFRRLIDAFHKACHAIAYAHSKGVLHRDLKPDNIMLGEYDEVLVVDWGIAKVLGKSHATLPDGFVKTNRFLSGTYATRFGQVAGTPAYMAPEQARGQISALDERTDIYALGGILYEILTGRAPYVGRNSREVIQQVITGPPAPIHKFPKKPKNIKTINFETFDELMSKEDELPLPDVLVNACLKAMSRKKNNRFSSVMSFIQILSDWLDGSKKREEALKIVESAMTLTEQKKSLKIQSESLAKEAEDGLEFVASYESEQVKSPWWAKEEEAKELARRAHALDVLQEQQLQAALSHKADLEEAHSALSVRYRKEHEIAESVRDFEEAQQAELRLREHAGALPEGHSMRVKQFNYLKGVGAISITTAQDDVQVQLERFVPHYRRLILEPFGELGSSPIIDHDLDMGSYLLRLKKPGFHDVLYPIYIGRGEHWDARAYPILMPKTGNVSTKECFVAGGWFWAGGDDYANGSWDRKKVWVDDFVMATHPVTNREYLDFLNSLVTSGREEDAMSWVPRERAGQAAQLGAMIYGRDEKGLFKIVPDGDGDLWDLDWPVLMVDWFSACAYAEWLSQKTKQSWRLPSEIEWEKSARGVDGRFFSWGNGFDPSYCSMGESHANRQEPTVVTKFSFDQSPYGVCGMVGNVRDWTSSHWTIEWGDSVRPVDVDKRVVRGGCWFSTPVYTRLARRVPVRSHNRSVDIGFRLVRSP